MAENKKSVLLYCDIIHTVEALEDVEAGKLFKHYLRYINDLNPEAPDKLTQIVFEPIKQNLKRDLKKWEGIIVKRSEAGIASAEKRKQNQQVLTSVDKPQQPSTNSTVTVKDTVTVKVKDIVKEIKKEYKEGVFLFQNEYDKLILNFVDVNQALEILSNYKLSSGKKYKSDYHALIGWVKDKIEKEKSFAVKKEKESKADSNIRVFTNIQKSIDDGTI